MNEKIELSPADVRILKLVAMKGLASEQEIAQKVRLNPSTINYKLRKFEKEKVIAEYRYRLNYNKIGLKHLAWIFLKMNTEDAPLEQLLDQFLAYPHVHAALNLTGHDDIALKIFGHNLAEISQMVIEIQNRFKNYIKSASTIHITKDIKRHQIILDDKHRGQTKLNSFDFKLLEFLLANPKASIKEAAVNLKAHRNTVSSRLQRLFREKVILKKGARLNPLYYEDIGISFRAVMSFDVKSGCVEQVAQRLASFPEVHELGRISSHYDLIGVIRTKTLDDFYQFHRRIFKDSALKHLINHSFSSVILRGKTKPLVFEHVHQ